VRRTTSAATALTNDIASVGANSGIVRRFDGEMAFAESQGFSRREFRNREAEITAVGCIFDFKLQSARIQES